MLFFETQCIYGYGLISTAGHGHGATSTSISLSNKPQATLELVADLRYVFRAWNTFQRSTLSFQWWPLLSSRVLHRLDQNASWQKRAWGSSSTETVRRHVFNHNNVTSLQMLNTTLDD